MTNPTAIFRQKNPDTDLKTNFLLNVFMPGPFQTTKYTYQVDDFYTSGETWVGSRHGNVVVQVPKDFPFLLSSVDNYEIVQWSDYQKELEEARAKDKADAGRCEQCGDTHGHSEGRPPGQFL